MGKAKELLGLIASITEEGEQGPLNLVVGAKVKFMKDDQEMSGEICAQEDGYCYNQGEDAYCVKVGDEMMMVKSSDLIVGEARRSGNRTLAKKPNTFKKVRNEDAMPDEPAPAADALSAMDAQTSAIKECVGKMREMVYPEGMPNTAAALDAMDSQADQLKEAYEDELNHNPDGGGAGDGGTEIPTEQ